jgi:hypothetical protein
MYRFAESKQGFSESSLCEGIFRFQSTETGGSLPIQLITRNYLLFGFPGYTQEQGSCTFPASGGCFFVFLSYCLATFCQTL